ncbi:MAG TPA: hypothetical protein VNI83_13990 [Vicinamibacterales bacterium]|nr:hypothetical protein [Vicinamibacterales bacterium]
MPDNVTSMAYNQRNGPPWHGKGVPVDGLATAAECIRAVDFARASRKDPVDDLCLGEGARLKQRAFDTVRRPRQRARRVCHCGHRCPAPGRGRGAFPPAFCHTGWHASCWRRR